MPGRGFRGGTHLYQCINCGRGDLILIGMHEPGLRSADALISVAEWKLFRKPDFNSTSEI